MPDPSLPLDPRRTLGEREQAMLDFERDWWRHAGGRDVAVRERFGLEPTAYALELNRLIDSEPALEHDALLVRRLRRQRATRQRERSARRAAGGARDSRVQP